MNRGEYPHAVIKHETILLSYPIFFLLRGTQTALFELQPRSLTASQPRLSRGTRADSGCQWCLRLGSFRICLNLHVPGTLLSTASLTMTPFTSSTTSPTYSYCHLYISLHLLYHFIFSHRSITASTHRPHGSIPLQLPLPLPQLRLLLPLLLLVILSEPSPSYLSLSHPSAPNPLLQTLPSLLFIPSGHRIEVCGNRSRLCCDFLLTTHLHSR